MNFNTLKYNKKTYLIGAFMLIIGIAHSYAQEKAQVYTTGQWLDFNCQTISSLSDYIENPTNFEVSKYGGWKSHRVEATGFFRVEKINGRWWAIDPEGYLYIHKALNSINLNNHTPNQIYHFLKQYGFNGLGCWSDEAILNSSLKDDTPMAYCPKLSFIALYRRDREPRIEMPVFDDEFETWAKTAAEYFRPYINDPHVFAYFSDNELPWRDEGLPAHLKIKDHSDKNYIAAINFLQSRGKTADNWDTNDQNEYMAVMAERYYSIVSAVTKAVDPNHMYMGTRCHSTEKYVENFMINAGKYVDIFSANHYHRWGKREAELANMAEWSGRPILFSEYYAMEQIPENDGAGWEVKSQSDRGPFYQNFLSTFLETGNVVGFHWFKFEDVEDGSANKGVVNNNGEPYTQLLSYMQEFNDRIYDYIEYVDSRVKPNINIYPEADAYYKGSENYGTDPELLIKNSSSATYTREAYIRFDASLISDTVKLANIDLFSIATGAESGNYQAELVNNNSWSETEITIENSPKGSTVLKRWSTGDDIKIDVTKELNDALSKDKKLSIRIVSTLKNGNIPVYGSRENVNRTARPKLSIVTTNATKFSIIRKENKWEANHRLYPNPCTNVLNFSKKADKVEIIDTTGKKIKTMNIANNSIDLSELKQGCYIFRVMHKNDIYSQLVVKQ